MESTSKGIVGTFTNQNLQILSFCSKKVLLYQLHEFLDASGKACAAVIYLRKYTEMVQ